MTARAAGSGTAGTTGAPSPRVPRRGVVLWGLVASLGLLVSTVLPWVRATAPSALGGSVLVEATGSDAVPVATAAALVGAAAALALTLVGSVGGRLVGGVLLVAGLLAAAASGTLLVDPDPVAASAASQELGVGVLDGGATLTPWPVVALVLGLVLAATGVLAVLAAGGWARDERHVRAPAAPVRPAHGEPLADPDGALDERSSWDALSRGDDPSQGAPDDRVDRGADDRADDPR